VSPPVILKTVIIALLALVAIVIYAQVQPVISVGKSAGSSGQVSVGTSSVQLPNFPSKTVCVKATGTNTATVVIGFSSGVTTATGFDLPVNIAWCGDLSNVNLLFSISGTASQSLSWIATN